MLTLDLHTLPGDFSILHEKLAQIKNSPRPAFANYAPDYGVLYSLAGKYAGTTHFIIIGRGGSVTGFKALYDALAAMKTSKKVHLLDTIDPDYTAYLQRTCHPDDTLVIAISKSGDTVDVLENLLCFPHHKKIVVTENKNGALAKFAEAKQLEVVKHPSIGGRFSTGTECAFLPGALIYVDVRSVGGGLNAIHAACDPSQPIERNPALRLAAALYLAEQKGLTEVYAPLYSKALAGCAELFTQLLHESACKQGRGQTFLFMEAPECQHHSNQKFFDGPRRMAGVFTRVERPEHDVSIPEDPVASSVVAPGIPLKSLLGERLADAMRFEYEGVRGAADASNIPNATVTLDVLNPGTLGELIGFWEYVAVYSSLLRNVDPFDQPGVEASKRLSREKRLEALKPRY